jgi:AhpD family alkylhydroperoxidase
VESAREIIQELREPTVSLRKAIPDTWAGFGQLHEHAVADGALKGHVKEIMATAIAVATGCDGCIAYHARAAARKGASKEEMAEGLGVALLMTGGPASVYAPRAWRSFLEYAEPDEE